MMRAQLRNAIKKLVPSWVLGAYRDAKIKSLVRGYNNRIVRHSYGGQTLQIALEDPLGEGWYDHDWPALAEIQFVAGSKLKPGAIAYDLGAHQGVVALMLAVAVGPQGKVLAVEGNPHNARVAEKNKNLNTASNLHVLHAAVGKEKGEIEFNVGLNGAVDDGTGSWGKVKVPMISIDELAETHGTPQVVFIDVEGYECEVLAGAKKTLTSLPDCFVEVHMDGQIQSFGGSLERVLSFFPKDKYALHMNTEGGEKFVPFEAGHEWTKKRFFLIATAK